MKYFLRELSEPFLIETLFWHFLSKKNSCVYLQSELSISKLSKILNENKLDDERWESNRHFFLEKCYTHFNIGFSAPAADECSLCIELNQRIGVEKKWISEVRM